MKIKLFIVLSSVLLGLSLNGQTVVGTVSDGTEMLVGASVFTADFKYGTTTDVDGKFSIDLPPEDHYHELSISFIGFNTQEIELNHDVDYSELPGISVELTSDIELIGVEIRRKKLSKSFVNPFNSELLDSRELTQAACCNLSESFENNATVDVSFTDAVTGAKKIKMLGIDGYYTQTLFENASGIRGLGNGYGLLFVPGPFMSSISVNKGSGSVTNGYESITGQINYEYKKPQNSERFYLNLFGSRHGQFELNTNFSHRFKEGISTMVLAHGMIHESIHDENNDGFQDVPLNERAVFMNRWQFARGEVFRSQLVLNYVFDDRRSGQLSHFFEEGLVQPEQLYDIETVSRKYDALLKTGFLFKNKLQSVGVQYRFIHHEQDSWYGNRTYFGTEDYANINFIFQTAMNKQDQTMKLGWSYTYDQFRESLDSIAFDRTESVPGIFAEYTYQKVDKYAFVGGLRADLHNTHGFWLSPRIHFKYNIQKDFVMKLNVGKGYRTANIFIENLGYLASSRDYVIDREFGYESAWNAGVGLFKEFYLGFQPASFSVDYYRTDFTHQVVVDAENPREIAFYQLDGKSYSNSLQIETEVEAFDNFDITLAYKFDDVHTTYNSGMKRNPYIPLHKVLLGVNYETNNEMWRFDVTGKFNSFGRIPSTDENPLPYRRATKSPNFVTANAQITTVVKDWEFYLGGENIGNFWQEQPIIAANDPFGEFFDSSMVWGPLGGTRLYAGLRFTMPYKEKKNDENVTPGLGESI